MTYFQSSLPKFHLLHIRHPYQLNSSHDFIFIPATTSMKTSEGPVAVKEVSTWTMPSYTGPFKVGTRLAEHQTESHEQFQLPFCPKTRTIKYRTFYPTSATNGKEAIWASAAQLQGFARFAGVPLLTGVLGPTFSYLLSHIRIPAWSGAEIESDRFPVVVFSHGLGGTDTSYSAVCGNLASYGIIVFAIEHRDHSASSTIIHDDSGDEVIDYSSPVNQADPLMKIRAGYMLQQRNLELRVLLRHIRTLDSMDGYLQSKLDLDSLNLVGHSFGAATLLHLIDSLDRPIKVLDIEGHAIEIPSLPVSESFRSAVLLDVWTQPLPDSLSLSQVPILNLVSRQFSQWPLNNDRLVSLAAEFSTMETVVVRDSLHLSQSDGGLLFPTFTRLVSGYKRRPESIMRENIERTLDFFNGYHGANIAIERRYIDRSSIRAKSVDLERPSGNGPLGEELEWIGAHSYSNALWEGNSDGEPPTSWWSWLTKKNEIDVPA